jgi:hypothetical protein
VVLQAGLIAWRLLVWVQDWQDTEDTTQLGVSVIVPVRGTPLTNGGGN